MGSFSAALIHLKARKVRPPPTAPARRQCRGERATVSNLFKDLQKATQLDMLMRRRCETAEHSVWCKCN